MTEVTIIQVSRAELREMIRIAVADAVKTIKADTVEATTSDPLLKIEEISKLLRVSKVTIHKWKKEGKIPFHRISNRIFFKEAEVLKALRKIDSL